LEKLAEVFNDKDIKKSGDAVGVDVLAADDGRVGRQRF
jgi:hypothetical protein